MSIRHIMDGEKCKVIFNCSQTKATNQDHVTFTGTYEECCAYMNKLEAEQEEVYGYVPLLFDEYYRIERED